LQIYDHSVLNLLRLFSITGNSWFEAALSYFCSKFGYGGYDDVFYCFDWDLDRRFGGLADLLAKKSARLRKNGQ
jgi:hypothetical protein